LSDEADIRQLVTNWVAAVAARDIDGVVAHHSDDLVMFDVPPPDDGLRTLAAYRESWLPFFDWQANTGGIFDLVELSVAAGADVGFAWALLRCGEPDYLAANPDRRLRVTFGLRKIDGHWTIGHEHGSFPLTMDEPG
jgi:ketosteroid isomerase-like protein